MGLSRAFRTPRDPEKFPTTQLFLLGKYPRRCRFRPFDRGANLGAIHHSE